MKKNFVLIVTTRIVSLETFLNETVTLMRKPVTIEYESIPEFEENMGNELLKILPVGYDNIKLDVMYKEHNYHCEYSLSRIRSLKANRSDLNELVSKIKKHVSNTEQRLNPPSLVARDFNLALTESCFGNLPSQI
ncbi:MAG: hypothetical protein [Caudoviricetes sp.]|nr:MAG: hypothetical protein [Caudoviricetes sp.]